MGATSARGWWPRRDYGRRPPDRQNRIVANGLLTVAEAGTRDRRCRCCPGRGVGAPGWRCAIRCARTHPRGRADEYICACMCVHALKWAEPVPETGRSRHPASWNRRFPTTPPHRCRVVVVVVVFFVGATAASAHPGALIAAHHRGRARSSAVAAAFNPLVYIPTSTVLSPPPSPHPP